jgi:hypothetical protein
MKTKPDVVDAFYLTVRTQVEDCTCKQVKNNKAYTQAMLSDVYRGTELSVNMVVSFLYDTIKENLE